MKLGWIDFSPKDRERAIEALNALRNRTEDELGTGVVRDAFANKFFPGTSTIQTRAKYFVLVPCAIRMTLENISKSTKHQSAMEELRRIENSCAEQMWATCGKDERANIIGHQKLDDPKWIVRPPSGIYWAGIRTFGIFISNIRGLGTWLNRVSRSASASYGGSKRPRRDDEDGIFDDAYTRFVEWKKDITIPEDIFRDFSEACKTKRLSPNLTRREADYLRGCIINSVSGSLLAFHLFPGHVLPRFDRRSDEEANSEEQTSFYKYVNSLRGRVPPETEAWLDQACAFNRLNFAANVLYNKMLAVPGAEDIWNQISGNIPGWMTADLPSIRRLSETPLTVSSIKFLGGLQEKFRARDYTAAEEKIRERELFLSRRKGKKAKLLHPGQLKKWVGVKWHDFRLDNASRILNDIANPEQDDYDHV